MTNYLIYILFFFAAFVHTSLGFGGGSSYSSILSWSGLQSLLIRGNSLICNLFSTSINLISHIRNKEVYFKDALKYTLPALPMVFIGSSIRTDDKIYFFSLGAILILSSILQLKTSFKINANRYTKSFLSALIGFISGFVGIGGGVLLSPFLLNEQKERKTTFITSFYIFANSLVGIIGYYINQDLKLNTITLHILIAAGLGALAGNLFSFTILPKKALFILINSLLVVIGVILIIRGMP